MRLLRRPIAVVPLALAAGLALAGCSGSDGGSEAAPTSSGTPSVDAGSTVPTDGPLDADQACAAMYVTGDDHLEERIGDTLVAVSGAFDAANADRMHALAVELGKLAERVPDEFAAALEKVRAPFTQLQEHIDSGTADSVELDIASATQGLKDYRALCS
jgi:hypothetical protein